MADPRIADDYSYIAQRMKEIEEERNPTPTPVSVKRRIAFECLRCEDKGWRYNLNISKWLRCGGCGNPEDKPRPTET